MTMLCARCGELVPQGCCTCGPRQKLVPVNSRMPKFVDRPYETYADEPKEERYRIILEESFKRVFQKRYGHQDVEVVFENGEYIAQTERLHA